MWVRRKEKTTKASSNESSKSQLTACANSSNFLSKTRTLSERVKRHQVEPADEDEWGNSEFLSSFLSRGTSNSENAPADETEDSFKDFSRERLLNHLKFRNNVVMPLSVSSLKKQRLVQLLLESLMKEREDQEKILDGQFQHTKLLEELGAVYTVGRNDLGQCGVGIDTSEHGEKEPRKFTVVPTTRGLGVKSVACGEVSTFAVCSSCVTLRDDEDSKIVNSGGEVYMWGGVHVGPTGIDENSKAHSDKPCQSKALCILDTPQLIPRLSGEHIAQISVGKSHACAISSAGDVFVWGYGKFGALGLGEQSTEICKSPVMLTEFENFKRKTKSIVEDTRIKEISCGDYHSCAVTIQGMVYSWGYASHGRLGLGKHPNAHGMMKSPISICQFVDRPHPIISCIEVTKVSCGSEHCLAMTSHSVFSWGSGDGNRLGHGDCFDRWLPEGIDSLNGLNILDVSAGMWHSACIASPQRKLDEAQVFTWGTGLFGQLGRKATSSLKPTTVEFFKRNQVNVKSISCGSHHNAILSVDGQLYTFGSNSHGCLGRDIVDKMTSEPGLCVGFGSIVNRIGRGLVLSVACGKEFTVVATQPYEGPTEQEVLHLLEAIEGRDEVKQTERNEADEKEMLAEGNKIQEQKEYTQVQYLTSKRLCTSENCSCPGFQTHASKPFICRECGHSSIRHSLVIDDK